MRRSEIPSRSVAGGGPPGGRYIDGLGCDEPTAHLDTVLSRQLLDLLGNLKGNGTTLILASHDPIVCEWQLADRVVEMRDGRIVGDRSTE